MNRFFLYFSLLSVGLNNIDALAQNCPAPTGVSVSQTSICIGSSVTLNAQLPSGISTINWYTAATGGTPITSTNSTSTTFTPSAPGTYTFYAEGIGAGSGNVTQTFTYTGAVQQTTLQPGTYVIETWGADGYQPYNSNGKGGYAKGSITVTSTQIYYIYVGGAGTYPTSISPNIWTFNGGAVAHPENNSSYGNGGGASDVRTVGGPWDDAASLASRIIVAGGGGAGRGSSYLGGTGGGLTGGNGGYFTPDQTGGPTGGTQTAGGQNSGYAPYCTPATLGKAMTWNGVTIPSQPYMAGGGGGYYGGASGRVAGGGGSSYIGGVTSGQTIMHGQTGFVANPATNGNGYVRITGQASCVPAPRVATATVTVHALPTVSLGNDTAVCKNETNTITLNAGNSGATYLWNNNSNTQSINVNQTGQYWVKVTTPYNCSGSDTVQVTFNDNPIVNLGNDTTKCTEVNINLSVFQPSSTYLWDDNSTLPNRTITNSGQYFVTITNAQNCSSTDTININNFPIPTTRLPRDTSICDNTSILLNPGSFNSYLWDDNTTSRTRIVSGIGTYYVTVRDNNNCKGTDTTRVHIVPKAQTNGFSFIPYFYQELGKVQFDPIDPQNVSAFYWDFGDGATSTLKSPLHTYANPGIYTVRLTVSERECGSETYVQNVNIEFESNNIDHLSLENVAKIYPNPASDVLNIDLLNASITVNRVEVIDQLGRSINIKPEIGLNSIKITTENLAAGLYHIQLYSNKGMFNAKFEIIK